MKKLLGIVVLGLLWCGSASAITLYCDTEEWNDYLTLNVNYTFSIVQHPNFRGGKTFKADISDKTIFFMVEGEHWQINRSNGNFTRKILRQIFIKLANVQPKNQRLNKSSKNYQLFNEKGRSVARCPYLYLHTNLNVYSASDPLGVLFQSETSLLTSDGSPLPIGCV